jgi:uncharacterized protein YcfL
LLNSIKIHLTNLNNMKNCLPVILISFAAFCMACNSPTDTTTDNNKTADSSTTSNTKFPFTKQKGLDWEINKDDANTLTVLNVLKAMESKDYEAIGKTTADSIKSNIDGLKFNGTKAQMIEANKQFFATLKNIRIVPQDWISVVNKDKSQEWVRVWYTQYWEDMKGTRDSLNVFNDIQLKQGKVTQWNEYIQHFPKP